jgi:hypothetical protein
LFLDLVHTEQPRRSKVVTSKQKDGKEWATGVYISCVEPTST